MHAHKTLWMSNSETLYKIIQSDSHYGSCYYKAQEKGGLKLSHY